MDKTKLYIFLKEKDISLNDLALMTRIPFPTLAKYVHGGIDNPSIHNIKKLTTALSCSFEDIF